MERPSHIDIRLPRPVFSRVTLSGLAVSLPLVILWALTSGMGAKIAGYGGPLVFVPDTEKVQPRTPPPPPVLKDLPQVITVQPHVVIDQPQKSEQTIIGVTPPAKSEPQPPVASGPDRAASAITATHTSPPYPAVALRLGREGKVLLRLTVLADGHVGKAEIVSSSGSIELDEAAQGWIVAHWTYKPALDKGQPAASQVLATIVFNLKDQH
jgi:protein TonB